MFTQPDMRLDIADQLARVVPAFAGARSAG
jgi:hypothetical protein